LNVKEKLPEFLTPLSKSVFGALGVPLVTLWLLLPFQDHTTVVPFETVMFAGVKKLSSIDTPTEPNAAPPIAITRTIEIKSVFTITAPPFLKSQE